MHGANIRYSICAMVFSDEAITVGLPKVGIGECTVSDSRALQPIGGIPSGTEGPAMDPYMEAELRWRLNDPVMRKHQEFLDRLEQMENGKFRFLVVVGPPGINKS